MNHARAPVVLAALTVALFAGACSSSGGGTTSTDGGGPGVDGSTGAKDSSSGIDTSSGSPDTGFLADTGGTDTDGTVNGNDAAPDAPTSCVTSSTVIAIVQTATGCAFSYTGPTPAGTMNLLLTPGWGTVCFAGSSGNCGTGSSADGWWFSGPQQIALCDATCMRFYNQTIAGKLTVQLGCPTEACMH